MKRKTKQALAVTLAVVMTALLFIVPAQAAQSSGQAVGARSGVTGDCTWTLTDDGVLTISGSGAVEKLAASKNNWQSTLPVNEEDDPPETPWCDWGDDFGDSGNSGSTDSSDSDIPIKRIVIEDGVTKIERLAFSCCRYVGEVVIPDSVTEIDSEAFYDCGFFKLYANKNTAAQAYADSQKSVWFCDLSEVSLPASVDVDAMDDMKWMLDSNETMTVYTAYGYAHVSEINSWYRFAQQAKKLVVAPGSVDLPSDAFEFGSFTTVELPDTLRRINADAFADCNYLKSVTIPSSVEEIDSDAFAFCRALESVTIPSSVKEIDSYAFAGCISLESVTIPSSVKTIGNNVFFDCIGLKSMTLPLGVETIGNEAFAYCGMLTNVSIPKTVKSIGNAAFSPCRSLRHVELDADNPYYQLIDNQLCTKDGKKLVAYFAQDGEEVSRIPEGVTEIQKGVFNSCKLQHVIIPEGVSVLDNVFDADSVVEKLTIPASVTKINWYFASRTSKPVVYGYRDTYAQAFAETKKLVFKLLLPESVNGDMNGDGEVSITDATEMKLYLAETYGDLALDNPNLLAQVDANGDGNFNVRDVTAIQIRLAEFF